MYKYNFNTYFKETAQRFKKKIALVDTNNISYTYEKLDELSDYFASYLESQKNYKTQTIAINAEKNHYTIIAFLGCLKAGITYFFLDCNLPKERINQIIKKTNASTLFSKKKQNILGIKCLSIKEKTKKKKIFYTSCNGDHPAYIMFTSGSTGSPKGTLITHDSVINFAKWCKQSFSLSHQDNFSQLNPLYFDNSVFDLYNSLLLGGKLTLMNNLDINAPEKLIKNLKNNKCTIWFSTPSLLIYLINFNLINKVDFKYLKKIIFGGEGFPKEKLKKMIKILGNRKNYYNVYGPTECTCICSSHLIKKNDLEENEEVFITLGNIAENFKYEITDKKRKKVKDGNTGELVLYGPNVGLGYVNDKENTEKSFIKNENFFNNYRGYRTGDLVYFNTKKKQLYFVGREDTQIKHMGYRIELNEIEICLNKNENIREACVFYLKKPTKTHGKIITIISSGIKMNKLEVYKHLKKYLPNYFLPQEIIFTSLLKKNKNGKIDRVYLKDKYEKQINY